MRKFGTWVKERHPEFVEEGFRDWGKKALATGLTAGTLAIGGCTGKNCPVEPDANKPIAKPATAQQGTRTISIDDGRELSVPLGVDPLEYLQQVNQSRKEMGQPPLPIERTVRYLQSFRR